MELLSGSELEVIQKVTQQFPEMKWLTGEVTASPEAQPEQAQELSLGQRLFPALSRGQLKEFDRTAVGILILKWVLENDYDRFTDCQNSDIQLNKENFLHFREFARQLLPKEDDVLAMVTYMVINDLTKIKSVVAQVEQELDVKDVDHDVILYHALRLKPELSPSFMKLPTAYRNLMLEGLGAQFNIGQLMQAENVAASMTGVSGLGGQALDFYLLHALCDIGGAGGQFAQNGSVVLTEPTYRNFRHAIQAIQLLKSGESINTVYDAYLAYKANDLGEHMKDLRSKALVRLATIFRINEPEEFAQLRDLFNTTLPQKQQVLTYELTRYGTTDGTAILVYYAPALQNNIRKTNSFGMACRIGIEMLFRIFDTTRKWIGNKKENGVFTVMALELANFAAEKPKELLNVELGLLPKGNGAEIEVTERDF